MICLCGVQCADLQACVWLEEYLKHYKKCLVLVSHRWVDSRGELCVGWL